MKANGQGRFSRITEKKWGREGNFLFTSRKMSSICNSWHKKGKTDFNQAGERIFLTCQCEFMEKDHQELWPLRLPKRV